MMPRHPFVAKRHQASHRASTYPVHTYRSCGCMRLVYRGDFHAVLYYSNHTVWTLVWPYQFLCCVGLGSRHIDKHILVVLNVAEYVHQHRGQMYSRTKQQQGHVTGHLHSDSCLLVGSQCADPVLEEPSPNKQVCQIAGAYSTRTSVLCG